MRGYGSRWFLVAGVIAIFCAYLLLSAVLASSRMPVLAASDEPVETTASAGQRLHGEDNGQQIPPDLKTIDTLLREGRYPEAEAAAREALSRLETSGQGESLEAARYADRLVEALLKSGKGSSEETLGLAELAVKLSEQHFGSASLETAMTLARLGRAKASRADNQESLAILMRSLSILNEAGESKGDAVARIQQIIGRTYFQAGDLKTAKIWLEEALSAQESAPQPDGVEVARTLRAIADVLVYEDRTAEATTLLRRSVALSESILGPDHPEVALDLSSLGQALRRNGDFEEARSVLERAIAILDATSLSDSVMQATALGMLGDVLMDQADYPSAVPLFERELAIRLQAYGPDDDAVAATLNSLGALRAQMHDNEKATALFEQAAEIFESRLGSSSGSLAMVLGNQALATAAIGRYEDAEVLMNRSLEIDIANLGADNPMVAQSLADLATAILEPAGEYKKAREAAQRAVEILDAAVEPDDFRFLYALMSLSGAVRGTGDLAKALRLSQKALEIQERTHGPLHPDTANMQISRARMLAEYGDVAAARALASQGETVSREHFVLTARSASEHEALAYAAGRVSGIDLLISIAAETGASTPGAIESAWDSVIRSRALVLDEMMARRRIARPGSDPQLTQLHAEVTRASEALARLAIDGPGEMTPAEFMATTTAVMENKERAERAFAARSDEFRKIFERDRVGYDQIVSELPSGSALVALVRYGRVVLATAADEPPKPLGASTPSYAAFISTAGSEKPVLVQLGPAAQIEDMIDQWYRLITQEAFSAGHSSAAAEAAYRDTTIALRRAVWDPIAMNLAHPHHVFVVPDGTFNYLDVSTLPSGDSAYLADSGLTIHNLSSERDLLMDPRESGAGQLLALGAPDFDSTGQFASLANGELQVASIAADSAGAVYRGSRSVCGSFQSMTFEPLPAAAKEVEEILSLWRQPAEEGVNSVALTGAAATESAFKKLASRKQVLHLATHGFFLGGDCGSVLDLREDDVTRENPLLLSGLVLAGANHRAAAGPDEDDGILTAEEIATLDLSDTEWAVLSACNTGRGEIRNGEGVLGLHRAFRMAGARTLIMSLWPVEDEVARDWMTGLYRRHFVDGRSTMEAVHDASLELLAGRRAHGLSTHPFYWAGFIASGDWR